MSWYGKAIGALIGYFLTRHPFGILVGVIIGHYFDMQAVQRGGSPHAIPEAFFRTTFQVMGHVAKADGRVSEEEIRAARAVMAQFRLGDTDVRRAIDFFTEGKAGDFPLQATLAQLRQMLGDRADLRRMFVQIQLQTALLGDGLHAQARVMLLRVCQVLGVSEFEFAQMEAILRMQRASGGQPYGARSNPGAMQDAYGVLGISSDASDSDVTKAYRRQMSQNHPDKLAAKGLPESMKSVAEEKTRQIRAAYEQIREARGMK